MSVELRHLRAFVVVAEEAHVGRAAKRLFISQPALSRQMQQLEREVGAPLLIRTPQGVELTETGTELLDRAHVALEAAEDALAVGRLAAPRGPLMLGLPLAGKRDRWFDLVQAFMRRYPEVEVHPRIALTEELQDQVLAGELDGAIGLAPARRPSLTYTHLHEEPLAVFLHVDHPLATRAELSLHDLEGVQVTVVGRRRDQPSGHDAALRALFVAAGVTPRFVPTAELFPARAGHRERLPRRQRRARFPADGHARALGADTDAAVRVHPASGSGPGRGAGVPAVRRGPPRGVMR